MIAVCFSVIYKSTVLDDYIDNEYFTEINPGTLYIVMTENFTKGYFFHGRPRYRAKPLPKSVIAWDVLSLANMGGPDPAPIHHTVIDGKAKPLNAPNYLVNRAKCTTRAPARSALANDKWEARWISTFPLGSLYAIPHVTSSELGWDETANCRYKLIRWRQRYALITLQRGVTACKLHLQ